MWQAWHLATSTFTLCGSLPTSSVIWHGTPLETWSFTSHAILVHTTLLHPLLSHTVLPHHSFSHSTFTHDSFTHTPLLHITPLHTLLSPTTLLHGTRLFHTPHFDMHFLHTPILHHLFSLSCLSHPIFTFLWLLFGRSWQVGFRRSFNFLYFCWTNCFLMPCQSLTDLSHCGWTHNIFWRTRHLWLSQKNEKSCIDLKHP